MIDAKRTYAEPEAAGDLIEALYDALLQRKPDAFGLADKVKRLTQGGHSLAEIVQGIVRSDEFAARLPSLLAASDARGLRFTNDVSQFGEIWMLVRL